MIGETKAATDGAGSAEWSAAADCRVLRVDEPGWQECGHLDPGPGCQVARWPGAPLISWTGPGHHTAGCQAPAFLLEYFRISHGTKN